MKRLVLESYLLLLEIEWLVHLGNLVSIHSRLLNQNPAHLTGGKLPVSEDLCHAMDLACVFYIKPVLCLQRCAATTLLLRRYGYRAEMVIGAHLVPFKAHAWVEIEGVVVNDKPYILDTYEVLERC